MNVAGTASARPSPPYSLGERLRGALTLAALVLVTVLAFIPFLPLALIKLILPTASLKRRMTPALVVAASAWVRAVSALLRVAAGVRVECRGERPRDPDGRYLLIANHRTWADILVLVNCLDGHLPFPRFFIKHELLWLPVVGFACWAMDFPFMRRYGKRELARRPELKGKDLETTRRACEKYRHLPVTVINFAEGTRFTELKRDRSRSPYRHLLRPKAAGSAFMLQSMSDVLTGVLDVTLVYPDCPQPTLFDYSCGRVRRVIMNSRLLPVPTDLLRAGYQDTPEVRRGFQNWMNDIWRNKDREIASLLDGGDGAADATAAASDS